MLPTVDSDYYYSDYGGAEYSDIDTLLTRAAMLISSVITAEPLADTQIIAYKNAVCAEAEFIGGLGGISEVNTVGTFSSVSLGKFSMSMGSGGTESTSSAAQLFSPIAQIALENSGLVYKGVQIL